MTDTQKVLKVYIPSNIDLDVLLNQYPIEVPNHKQYLIYILSRIKRKTEFTQISSKAIKKRVDQYAPLLDWLIKRDIIECSPSYKVGQRPKGYRFKAIYLTELKEETITLKTLIRKTGANKKTIIDKSADDEDYEKLFEGNYGYQPRWIRLKAMAEKLSLKPIKMRQGLEILGLIYQVYEHQLPANTGNVLCCYELINSPKRIYHSIIIDENAIDEIKQLVEKHPTLFPKSI